MAERVERAGMGFRWALEQDGGVESAPGGEPFRAGRRVMPVQLILGGLLVTLVLLTALYAPDITRYAPEAMIPADRLLPPSSAHWFGTDAFGRDLFSRVVFGARLALKLSALSVLISAVPGVMLGLLAGYERGWLDQLLSRLMDAWLALPGLLLALLIISRTGPSLDGAILALGVTGIPSYFRLVRSSTLSLRQREYVEASRALGAGRARVLLGHILPNLLSSVIVLTSLRLGTMLLAGSSLSFIGLGAQPPAPEWGALMAEGRDFIDTAWWMFAFPLIATMLTVLGYNLLGDGLRDYLARR
jgi:ABC-type dipeptide/oligopeptide/nickel transport system permease subunit